VERNTGIGQKMYKSGDVTRIRSSGAMEFIGRKDRQVKINGYRLGLSEVERELKEHGEIDDAFVLLDENGSLSAFYTSFTRQEPDTSSLRAEIGRRLPSYMIPATFTWLSQIPLTVNGKD
jgi:acyl-coenzyme A synthetase/AMP-(fatty) acid ligase